ncbi:MAG: hypothetical protein KY475_09310, partial [Planctomycetes bacterium]|nr:hypothetical protein [Planctomycetota bacterium]
MILGRLLFRLDLVSVQYDSITTPAELLDFCDSLAGAEVIAFDTEFVSEHSFRPQLCLVQVAVGERLAVIDPLSAGDLAPFWEQLAAPGREVIAHSAREELLFCLRAVGRPPAELFDTQIAAGLMGL